VEINNLQFVFVNGWKHAPHCWRTFLTRPFRREVCPYYTTYTILGIVIHVVPQ
jgi:hypothetical protein